MLISVPITENGFFCYIATLYGGSIRLDTRRIIMLIIASEAAKSGIAARGMYRAVLALRRHCLIFPVSVAVHRPVKVMTKNHDD